MKFVLNARNIGYGQTTICLVPLNIQCFSTKKDTSAFYTYITNRWKWRWLRIQHNTIALRNALVMLNEISVEHMNEQYAITLLWCSDLKALVVVSTLYACNQFCPYCAVKKSHINKPCVWTIARETSFLFGWTRFQCGMNSPLEKWTEWWWFVWLYGISLTGGVIIFLLSKINRKARIRTKDH